RRSPEISPETRGATAISQVSMGGSTPWTRIRNLTAELQGQRTGASRAAGLCRLRSDHPRAIDPLPAPKWGVHPLHPSDFSTLSRARSMLPRKASEPAVRLYERGSVAAGPPLASGPEEHRPRPRWTCSRRLGV